MAARFELLKPGDELTCAHINRIYTELNRWRKLTGSGTVDVDYADATSPPVVVGYGDDGLIPVVFPTGIAAGTLGTPSSKADVLMVKRSGNGYTTTGGRVITVYNCYATAITGTDKFGYVRQREDGKYILVVADC